MNIKKLVAGVLVTAIVIVLITTYACNKIIVNSSKNKLFTDTKIIPFNKVGLLLGTSKFTGNNRINPFYSYRIKAAAELIKSNRIKYLVISGDNSTKKYNEPDAMREDLIKEGIDSNILYLDYAGFRTFDSVLRLKEIFGQDSVTIISQQFHNERAIYIASREGINAIGFNANDVGGSQGFKTLLREKLARVKVFLDFLFDKKPKYLGSKIIIPS
ncbi:MAG TPA: ElyC/SanA/YdcF family protein [Ginsengibacter sp.]